LCFFGCTHLSGHGLALGLGLEGKVFCFFSSEKKAFLQYYETNRFRR